MAYTPPVSNNINFDMPSSYTPPSIGAISVNIGGATTTIVDMVNTPLVVGSEIESEILWYSLLNSIEGSTTLSNPDIVLSIGVGPFQVNAELTGTAQQRVFCKPLVSVSTIDIVNVKIVPEGYTVLSPWPMVVNPVLTMGGVAITVVDSAFNTENVLFVSAIEANGQTVVDVPPLENVSLLRFDIEPNIVLPTFTIGTELECFAISLMPAGDIYLKCLPFVGSSTLENPTPGFIYNVPGFDLTTQLVCDDVYSGNLLTLEPMQISSELSSKVSAAISLNPFNVGSSLSPDFLIDVNLDVSPLETATTLEIDNIFVGSFVEVPAFECRASMKVGIGHSLYLTESEGHLFTTSEIKNPEIVKTVICQPLEMSNSFSDIELKIFTLDFANQFYYFKLTDPTETIGDIWIPISSFQSRKRNGAPSYLQVVIPGVDFSPEIADRSNGNLEVYLTFKIDGKIVKQQLIIDAQIDSIRIDEGPENSSITLTGYKTESFVSKEIELTGETYKSIINGKFRYRVSVPSLELTPGDIATIGGETFTIDVMSYYFRATKNGISQTMELAEE